MSRTQYDFAIHGCHHKGCYRAATRVIVDVVAVEAGGRVMPTAGVTMSCDLHIEGAKAKSDEVVREKYEQAQEVFLATAQNDIRLRRTGP